ncbi:hypothetical protein ACVWZA_002726 [Sphingomonas sp. UYAg733]
MLWEIATMIASTAAQPVAVVGAERTALLDVARAPVSKALGKPVLFQVDRLNRIGDWVFLLAQLADRGGAPVDYAGTPKADAARHGMVSRRYAALMRREGDLWVVVADAIGPTDVAWADWATRYDAPPALF